MRVLVQQGRARIALDMPSAAELQARVRQILGPAVTLAEEAVDEVHKEMLATWPIKSGASREGFHRYLLLEPEKYRAEVGLRTDLVYVRYLKSTKVGRRRRMTRLRSPLQTDIRQPIVVARRELLADLRQVLVRHLQKGFYG